MAGISNGVQKMCFAESHAAIQEKRIVGTRRFLCDCLTGCMRKPVARTNHKGFEEVTRIHI